MFGAVLGDIIGSRFEFDRGGKTKEFRLFTKEDDFTDDSVMTVGVAEGLLNVSRDADEETIKKSLIEAMQKYGRRYPYAGYGSRFISWVHAENPQPYNSYGNGSAMRVSAAGWLYDSLERTLEVAGWSAEISHNHPEGIKGAQCTAAVIFLSRMGNDKETIKEYVLSHYDYDLSESLDEMRKRHEHIETCMDSMPKALVSFFEGNSYEDVIRNAVSLGGDTDTIAAIAGAMAEAYYDIPEAIKKDGKKYIAGDIKEVIGRFYKKKDKHIELDGDFNDYLRDTEREVLIEMFGKEEAEQMMKEGYKPISDEEIAASMGMSVEEFEKWEDEKMEQVFAELDEILDADEETLKEKWPDFAMESRLDFDENVAKTLVEKGYSFNDLHALSKEDFMTVLGIGDKKAKKMVKAVKDYFSENEPQPEPEKEETAAEIPEKEIRYPDDSAYRIDDDGTTKIELSEATSESSKQKDSKTEELREKVRNLRAQGLTYKKIGEQLGITGSYAHILDKPEMYKTEEKKAKQKEYRDKAREYNLEYGKKWRDSNPDYMKKWYQENKGKYKQYQENQKKKRKENITKAEENNDYKNLKKALDLARRKHSGQEDKSGDDYIFHPIIVALQCKTVEAKIVALLHDVLEDTDTSVEELESLGFDYQIIETLSLLNHDKNKPYEEYIKQIKQSDNDIAIEVKLADLTTNMDTDRLGGNRPPKYELYKWAYDYLSGDE